MDEQYTADATRAVLVFSLWCAIGLTAGGQECVALRAFEGSAQPTSVAAGNAAATLSEQLRVGDQGCEDGVIALLSRGAHSIDQIAPVCRAAIEAGSPDLRKRMLQSAADWAGIPQLRAGQQDAEARRVYFAGCVAEVFGDQPAMSPEEANLLGEVLWRLVSVTSGADVYVNLGAKLISDGDLVRETGGRVAFAIARWRPSSVSAAQWGYLQLMCTTEVQQLCAVVQSHELPLSHTVPLIAMFAAAHSPEFPAMRASLENAVASGEVKAHEGDLRMLQGAQRLYQMTADVHGVLAWFGEANRTDDIADRLWAVQWLFAHGAPAQDVRDAITRHCRNETLRVRLVASDRPEATKRAIAQNALRPVLDKAVTLGFLTQAEAAAMSGSN